MCPEGAATYAACKQALADGRIRRDERAVLFNCATGLKYPLPPVRRTLDRHQADRLRGAVIPSECCCRPRAGRRISMYNAPHRPSRRCRDGRSPCGSAAARRPIPRVPSPWSRRSRRAGRPTRWRAFSPSPCAPRSASPSSSRTSPAPAALSASAASRARRPTATRVGIGQWATHVVNGVDLCAALRPARTTSSRSRCSPITPQLIIATQEFPGERRQGADRLAQGQSGQGERGDRGRRRRRACAGVYFQQATGTRFSSCPIAAARPAMQDLVSGQIDIMFDQGANALRRCSNGSDQGLCRASPRIAGRPCPTSRPSTRPACRRSTCRYWHGLWAPKGTPKEIIAKLNAAVVSALADRPCGRGSPRSGRRSAPREQQTPEALAAFHKAETEKWWPIIKAANHQGGMKPSVSARRAGRTTA